MIEKLLGLLIIAGIACLIFVIKASSKKYIETKFDEQLEQLKNELQKTTIQTTASYNYKQFATQEAFSTTIDLYGKIFDAREVFQKLWDRKIENDEANTYLKKLKEYQKLVFSKQILLDEKIFEHFKNIFGGMLAISLHIRMDLDVESKEIKEIKTRIVSVTNIIRDNFGLKSIPEDIVGNQMLDLETDGLTVKKDES